MTEEIEDLIVAMEELSELTQAISKYLRGKKHNIAEEIADVEIVIDKVKKYCDIKEEDIVDWKKKKIKRLSEGYRWIT